jgi:hypothetical protein
LPFKGLIENIVAQNITENEEKLECQFQIVVGPIDFVTEQRSRPATGLWNK